MLSLFVHIYSAAYEFPQSIFFIKIEYPQFAFINIRQISTLIRHFYLYRAVKFCAVG